MEHKPYVPASEAPREFSAKALIMGALLGIVFAASSVYLGLKVGLTVSASIPVAVLSITIFRWIRLRGTILENNIAQTTGSAGESLAAGVAFTLPSLLVMGFELDVTQVFLVALLGGLIGVLMMIPLRNGLIVKEHGNLAYPEGTACADVLIVGEEGGSPAAKVFLGFFVGLGYAFLNLIAKLWSDVANWGITFGTVLKGKAVVAKGALAFEVSPPMLGVGYIIGPKVAANMFAGGVLAYLVLIPLISMLGGDATATLSASKIRSEYVLYIGAGAVAAGGFVALARSIPTIVTAFRRGLGNLGGGGGVLLRTEQDLSMKVVLGGSVAILLAIVAAPPLGIDWFTAILIVVFGFFFVTVSSRITGEIGSSSNPISGMTIATLLLTCGLFVLLGRVGVAYKAIALATAAIVCVAASNGGTISQDLKTGFLVGATPKKQQLAILVGVVTSAVVIGFVMQLLLKAGESFQPVAYDKIKLQPTTDRAKGPDGNEYAIAYSAESAVGGIELPRGKYLVDDAGAPQYFVVSAVDPAYPYKWKPASDEAARIVAAANWADSPQELGPDHRQYRGWQPKENGTRYLISDDGRVAFESEEVKKLDAPKANLFALIIDGTLGGSLPWGLVLIGVMISLLLELMSINSLSFAVGLYLPIATSGGIFVGGLVRLLVDRVRKTKESEADFSPGMLMASGLIAGGSIAGVIQSAVIALEWDSHFDMSSLTKSMEDSFWFPMSAFLIMSGILLWVGLKAKATGVHAPKPNNK